MTLTPAVVAPRLVRGELARGRLGATGSPRSRFGALLAVLLFLSGPGWAQGNLAPLASQNFDEIRRGIEQLAVSGDPHAAPVLEALQAGRLLSGPGGLFIKDASGNLTNAETGEPASAASLRPVRVNNAVRRAVDAAMG